MDGPLSAPLGTETRSWRDSPWQMTARAGLLPPPPSNNPSSYTPHNAVPLYTNGRATPDATACRPGARAMIKQRGGEEGGETKLTGEYSAVRARVRLINSRLALPSNTIAGRFHGNELWLVKHHCRGTAFFCLPAESSAWKRREEWLVKSIASMWLNLVSFENVVIDY